ncbi:MAG TPA: SH3 domain-containing protein [Thermoanaerobaculia bacterium]|nr:SH3 domain-containing protein [Thermoanaerobaculia bacterium]
MRTNIWRSGLAASGLLLLAGCQTGDIPEPEVAVVETVKSEQSPVAEEEESEIGSARVTATTLNLREAPGIDQPSISVLRRGDRVGVIRQESGWTRVRVPNGERGWVASRYLRTERGCPADREFRFIETPLVSFSDQPRNGVVTVEALVDISGKVVRTKVTRNTTGEAELATAAESEIRRARFAPPIRNCAPRSFIYLYERRF